MSSDEIQPLKLQKEESKKDNSEQFDPIKDIKDFLITKYSEGLLPLLLLVFIVIYNFIFFGIFPGYEIYTYLPIIGTIGMLLIRYWENRDSGKKMALALLFLLFSAGLDLLVSISFELSPTEPRFQYRAVPTIIADILVFVTFIGWYFQIHTKSLSDLDQQKSEEVDQESWDEDTSQEMIDQMIKRSEEIEEEVKEMNLENTDPKK